VNAYRVFPHNPDAAPTEKGGALFAPRSSVGRIDNPSLYAALYVADTPEAAIAETFGRLPLWRPADFIHASGCVMTIATYTIPDTAQLCDLDDITTLAKLGIHHPSRVITRDRSVTQAWAQRVYEQGAFAGVQWWCYYNPEWRSIALWDLRNLTVSDTYEPLHTAHPLVQRTATAITRQIDT
jgi:hypothetical protein